MTKFTLTAQLKLQPPNNVGSVVNNIRQQLQGITATVNVVVPPQSQRNLQAAQKTMQKTAKAAEEAKGAVEAFGGAAALAAKRFLAFSIAGGAIIKFTGALTQGVGEAIAFEREMNKIAQATGSSAKAVSEISTEITKLSTAFGTSSIELSKASLVLAQAGLTAQDTRKSLEALAKSDLAPTFESINDTAEASIAMFQQFGVSADTLEKKLGSINTVAAKFAVESSDITTAVRRTGGAFAAAGGSLEELLALFTSVRQTTRESAESIATGFRTIFTRLQRVRTQNFLSTMGVDLKNLEGQFVGPYEAIRRLSTAMKGLQGTDPRFAQIVEELGGFRQISKVIPLIQQFEVSQKALNVAMAGTGSLSEDAARAQETLAVQIQKTKEQFSAMLRKFVGSSEFKGMVTVALKLAEAFTKIAESLVPLLPLITAFGAISLGRAVGPFLKGAKAKTAVQGAAAGGPILYAAGGGLVPGTGNRDTVPAMLTPGEFVLRKKAVSALGLNKGGRVSKVQKFAAGGYSKNKAKYEPIQADNFDDVQDLNPALQGGVGGIFLNARGRTSENAGGIFERGTITVTNETGTSRVPFTAAGFSRNFMKQFEDEIGSTIVPLTNKLGKDLASQLGSSATGGIANRYEIPNYASIVGGFFEGAIKTLGPPFTTDNAAFDFPKGLQGTSNSWAGGSTLANIPVDAKRTWTTKAKASIAKKTQAVLDDMSLLETPKKVAWNQGEALSLSQAKSLGISQSTYMGNAEDLLDEVQDRGYTDARIVLGGKGGSKKEIRYAQGGKVPALLTPGEIVVDKETAAKLGPQALKKLNHAEKFMNGGAVQRNVGYIDSDVLDNPENAAIVGEQMKKLGIKGGASAYHNYLVQIASAKRKLGTLKKFKAIHGVPGAGKTHRVKTARASDDATLRKTTRFPILTPEDIDRATEVVDALAHGPKAQGWLESEGPYQNLDRMFILSSSTREEQALVAQNRKLREQQTLAGISTTAEGRSAAEAATKGAPLDTSAIEAVAYKTLGKRRAAVLGMQPGYKLRRKSESEIPDLEEEMIAIFYGALSPATKGHAAAADTAVQQGIDPKNLFVNISRSGGVAKEGDEHGSRTVIYDQNLRAALAQKSFPNATVVKAGGSDFMGTAPTLFERPTQGGRRKFVKAGPGSIAITGDDKDEKETEKYRKSGYRVVQKERDDISGTGAREAVRTGNEAEMERVFHPGALPLIKKNQGAIKAREAILPEIFKRVQAKIGNQVAEVEKELEAYPKVITGKIRTEQPEIAAAVAKLRDKRDSFKKMKEKLPPRYLALLGKLFKEKYGYALEMSQGGSVPAMLTPGEAVVSKNTASKIGTGKLQAFNQGGLVRKFAGGGGVMDSIGGIGNIGFALSAVTGVINSFSGLNDTVKNLLNTVTMLGTQFGVLFLTMTKSGEFFQKYNKRIEEATKNVELARAKQQKIAQDRTEQKEIIAKPQKLQTELANLKTQGLAAKARSKNAEQNPNLSQNQKNYVKAIETANRKAIAERIKAIRRTELPQANMEAPAAAISEQRLRQQELFARRDIVLQKRSVRGAQLRQNVFKGASIAGAISGALAQGLGSYAEEAGRKQIEAGTGGEGQFRLGKTASSIGSSVGIGATIGAAFGPIGIAAGVAAGGLWGLYKGLKDANKEIANMKIMKEFNKSIEKTNKVLSALGEGKATFGEAKVQVDSQVASTIKNLRDPNTGADARIDIKASIKNSMIGFDTYLNEAAKKASSFGNFLEIANEDVIRFVATFSDRSTTDLKTELKKVVEANIKAKESTIKLTKVNDEYAERVRNLINVGQAFETLTLHMQKFDASINNASNLLSDRSKIGKMTDESALLANPEKFFDGTRFAELVARDITNNSLLKTAFPDALGGSFAPLNEKMTKDVTDASNAINQLPSVLMGLRDNLANFEGDQAVEKIMASFDDAPGLVSDSIRKVALNIIGGEGKEATLIEKIRSDFTGTLKEFNEELRVILEQAAQISKAMTDETNRRIDFMNNYTDLMQKELELRLKMVDSLEQSENIRAKAYNRPVNLDKLQALDDQKQREILGPDAAAINNPFAVHAEIVSANNRIISQQTALLNTEDKNRGDLITSIAAENVRVNNLTKALTFMGDVASRTAVTMQKIEKEQRRVDFTTNRLDKSVFAETASEVRDLALTDLAARVASTTGNIDFIPPKLRGDLKQLLDETKGLGQLDIFGGKTSEQVTADLRFNAAKSRGMSDADAAKYAKGTSDELEKQRKILEHQILLSQSAIAMENSVFDISLSTLAERFNASIKAFSLKMESIFNEQKAQELTRSKERDTLAREKSAKAGAGLEQMGMVAGTMDADTVQKLGNNLATIEAYQKEDAYRKSVADFRMKYNTFEMGGNPVERNVERFDQNDIFSGTMVKNRLLDDIGLATSEGGPNAEQRATVNSYQRSQIQLAEEKRMRDSGATDDVIEQFRDSFFKQLNDPALKQNSFVDVMGAMTRAIDETVAATNTKANTDVAGSQLEAIGLKDFADNIIQTTDTLKRFKEGFEQYQLDPRPYFELQRTVNDLSILIAKKAEDLSTLNIETGRNKESLLKIEVDQQVQQTTANLQAAFWAEQREFIRRQLEAIEAEQAARREPGMATGGFVRGYGTGDKVRAMLEPGEFVLNRNAVSAIGLGPLSSVNDAVARFATGGAVTNKGYTVNGITYKDYDDYFNQTSNRIKSSATSPEVFKANVEKIKADSAARQKEIDDSRKRMDDISNRGIIDTLHYDINDTTVDPKTGKPIVSGLMKGIARTLLVPAYAGEGAVNVVEAGVGGVKTVGYGAATGVVKLAHLGQDLHGIEDPYLDDLDRRLSSLTEATASDVRGNLSFGLIGTQGAEREQLTGGVGFSQDFTEGQKKYAGYMGTALDTTIGIGSLGIGGGTSGALTAGAKNAAKSVGGFFKGVGSSIAKAAKPVFAPTKSRATMPPFSPSSSNSPFRPFWEKFGAGADEAAAASKAEAQQAQAATAQAAAAQQAKDAAAQAQKAKATYSSAAGPKGKTSSYPPEFGPKMQAAQEQAAQAKAAQEAAHKAAQEQAAQQAAQQAAAREQAAQQAAQQEAARKAAEQAAAKDAARKAAAEDAARKAAQKESARKAAEEAARKAADDAKKARHSSKYGPSTDEALDAFGVGKNATKKEVRDAYRRMMKNNHPDHISANLTKEGEFGKFQGRTDQMPQDMKQRFSAELARRIEAAKQAAQRIAKNKAALERANRMQAGSLVPGYGSGDTVPALLEPGEFVLNRNAVRAVGVNKLSRLNTKIGRFRKGGPVGMQAGGSVGVNLDMSVMEQAVRNFGSYVDKFADLTNSINGLTIQLQASHTVEVIINGAQVLAGLNDSIQNLVVAETNKAINNMLDKKFQLPPMD